MLDTPPTSRHSLSRCREIALKNGLHFVYTGNVNDRHGASTWCPGCDALLVERSGYMLGRWNIAIEGDRGICADCGYAVAGVFEERPGTWGSRRLPVHVSV